MPSFYVKRTKMETIERMDDYGRRSSEERERVGYVGPIRSERQAAKEQGAWESSGWDAELLPSTPEVKREVRAWERQVRERRS